MGAVHAPGAETPQRVGGRKYRSQRKGDKYLHAGAQAGFGNVFLQVSSRLSSLGETSYSGRFQLRFL